MSTAIGTDRRSTWSERFDPRNWNLVTKLAVVGLIPTVLALTIGALRVVDQANEAEELSRGGGLVDVHSQLDGLTGALQAERNAAAVFVAGNRLGDRAGLDAAQSATDQAVRGAVGQLDGAERQAPQLAGAVRQVRTTLGQLPVIRSQAAGGPTPAIDVTTRYTSVVQRVLGLDRALLGRLQTADTAGLTTALGAQASALEALELERAVVNGAITSGQLDEAQRAQITGAGSAFQAATGDVASSLTPEQAEAFGEIAAEQSIAQRQGLRDQVLATAPNAAPAVAAPAWNAAVDTSVQATRGALDRTERAFVDARNAAAEDAGNTAGINSVLLMLTLLLTGGIVLLLGRQMVRSLRLLRSSALDVAERRLPAAVQGMRSGQAPNALVEPVPLDSRDEIGEVARAFDAVHGQAIRLAADQAALQQNVNSMFVNLSRRSQALVERQLQLIEQLESNEQDPDQLSNLFQLDHLATRMRRNSENLLVLAGTDLAKRNVAPVQIVDVLRAAVSEVEQYQRVVVQTPPNATVAGRAANDLVHLLAELLDNATNFSPPDSQVVMTTTRTADQSLLIEISDRGVGMSDVELVDANRRLSGPAEVDVSASRRMGLFVVGRLAARHRVGVRLASGAAGGGSGGLNASVTVPVQLIPSASPVEQPHEPRALPAPEHQEQQPAPAVSRPPHGALNGTGRGGSLPSMVAGTDGPLTPTFEAGPASSTGTGRNGSSALPTRKPGSSLRRNNPDGASETTDGNRVNGSAPGGMQSLGSSSPEAPAAPERDAADIFTAGTEDEATTGITRPERGDTAPDGTAAEGPEQETTGEQQPGTGAPDEADAPRDAGRGSTGRAAGALGAAGIAGATAAAFRAGRGLGPAERSDAAPEPGVTDGQEVADGSDAATGQVPRNGARVERDLDETVVMDAATDDGPPDEPPAPEPAARAAEPGTTAEAEPPADDADRDEPEAPRTRALPVRQPGREPMGGPIARRPSGSAPGPAPRPVMPAGRAPARGPQPPVPNGRPVAEPHRNGPVPLPKRRPVGPQGASTQQGNQEALFAPKVPAEHGDRGQLRRPGALESTRGNAAADVDMGQTTPIFDDIASAWFRSNRSVPVNWQQGADPSGRPPADEREPSFDSPADAAWWQARQATDEEAEGTAEDLTHAGLPKRRPRARLLPGSAAGSTVLSPPAGSEARSAESVRGRLSSYQQGVRQGRESASGRPQPSGPPGRETTGAGGAAGTTPGSDGAPEPSDRPNQSDPEENQ